jgi:hypothetical protein
MAPTVVAVRARAAAAADAGQYRGRTLNEAAATDGGGNALPAL